MPPNGAEAVSPSGIPEDPYPDIPVELKALDQWVLWRLEPSPGNPDKLTKVPYNAKTGHKASSTLKHTWSSYKQVIFTFKDQPTRYHGIGFVFSDTDPYIGIDYDDVIQEGILSAPVQDEVQRFGSYTELSQSGKGIHIIGIGTIKEKPNGREIYDRGRYFVFTGKVCFGLTQIKEVQAVLDDLISREKAAPLETTIPIRRIKKGITYNQSITDKYNLRVEDIARPVNGVDRGNGEIQGEHPFHGSKTGMNFSINTHDNSWYCFRDKHGGGALELLAMREGILDCERDRIGPGCLDDKWSDVFGILRKCGYIKDDGIRDSAKFRYSHDAGKDEPPPGTTTKEKRALPQVQQNGRNLEDVTLDVLKIIENENNPPKIFIRSMQVVRIGWDEHNYPIISRMDEPMMLGRLSQCLDTVHITYKKDGDIFVPVVSVKDPKPVLVRNIISRGHWNFPTLIGVTESPIIHENGDIVTDAGYDHETRMFYAPAPGLTIPPIPERPSKEDLQKAVLLLNEIIADFPFADPPDRANAIAAMVTSVIRTAIPGKIPMYLIDKPQAGTGASLLAEVISMISTGRGAAMMTAPISEEEWLKKITSLLMVGKTIITVDNIEGKLYSANLASLLTSTFWEDRVLGRSEMIKLPNRSVWIGTGNNIILGGDLGRRCYTSRMDSHEARPWKRTGFKHPNLLQWVEQERGNILAAILTIARGWIRSGREKNEHLPNVGGFEEWVHIVGGILKYAGVPCFLKNLNKMYDESDIDTTQWDAFIATWYSLFKDRAITVSEIVYHLMEETDSSNPRYKNTVKLFDNLPDYVSDAWVERKRFTRVLGKALAKKNGVHFPCDKTLCKHGMSHQAATWMVIQKDVFKTSGSRGYPPTFITQKRGVGELGEFSPTQSQIFQSTTTNNIEAAGINSPNSLTPLPDVTHQLSSDCTTSNSNCSSFSETLKKFGINTIPDLSKYTRIKEVKVGRCIIPGCTDSKMFEDENGFNYLCGKHYKWIKDKTETNNNNK